jgi:hypothetical protein
MAQIAGDAVVGVVGGVSTAIVMGQLIEAPQTSVLPPQYHKPLLDGSAGVV